MMMAFRRWGHFYLALSNEALRKRTQEQNQARSQVCGDAFLPNSFGFYTSASSVASSTKVHVQPDFLSRNMFSCRNLKFPPRLLCDTPMSQRDMPEEMSLSIMERPRNERGRSRRSSSAGRRSSGGQRRLQLSSSDVQAMVEQEAESVARELASEPSLSLLALADARKEMDDIAMKAQVCMYTEQFPSGSQHSPRF